MSNRKGSPSSSPTHTSGGSRSNSNPLLGMIVDRSSFDESDEFGLGGDVMSVTEDEGTQSDGGVVMKNGKVRRRLRWKPPAFRKKKNHSSNMSVISALTNKSNTTNRSFMTNFSRKSNSSFHTFHSTETPVVTNRASQAKAKAQAMSRQNYPDTVNGKHSTIDNEGQFVHSNMGSEKLSARLNEVSVQRSSTLPSRLDDLPASPISEQPPPSSGSSVISDPFDFSVDPPPTPPPPSTPPPKQNKLRRPPRDKRQSCKNSSKRFSSGRELSATSSHNQETSSSQLAKSPIPSVPAHALASSISMERENSVLPTLSPDDYEEDRRVAICIGNPRADDDYGEEVVNGPDAAAGGVQASPNRREASPILIGAAGTLEQKVEAVVKHAHAQSENRTVLSTSSNRLSTPPRPPPSESRREQNLAQASRENPKNYNRPVDISSNPAIGSGANSRGDNGEDSKVLSSSKAEDDTTKTVQPARRSPTTTIPLDLDEGTFLEAENNLRAIHDMAAEHLAHGEYEEAIEVFEEILRGQQERYGHSHYRVGTALHNLGIVHLKRGDYKMAISTCSQAVAVRRDALVPDHPDVAVSLAQLGVAYLECGQYAQALLAFKEALHIRRTFLGPKHPKCSKILNNIGCALYSLDELEGSRLAFEEALGIQREMLRMIPLVEDAHDSSSIQSNQILLSVASTLSNIGSIKLRWGRFDDAGVALEEALLIQQSVLGDDHPMVANTMESIEFVEKSKENAIPSAHDVLSKWETSEESEYKENTAMCTTQPALDRVLSLNAFSALGPKRWYKRVEDAITDSGCGPYLGVEETSTPLEPSELATTLEPSPPSTPSTPSDRDIKERFSV